MSACYLTPDWPVHAAVRAAFTLRTGGVSRAPFASLNVATHVGDAPRAVAENRARVREVLSLRAEPAWLDQVHGNVVADLDAGSEAVHGADAAVTRASGCVLAIQVADCLPVLFAAQDGSAVGAAHCGWRGLSSGVLEATVRALGLDAGKLSAWLGPAIGPAAFEVGAQVRDAYLAQDARAAVAFTANARGRWQCDLYELARQRLNALGVQAVFGGGLCTHSDPARFFSFRRDGRCGRMAALIWIHAADGRMGAPC